jgi:hypothetical protein
MGTWEEEIGWPLGSRGFRNDWSGSGASLRVRVERWGETWREWFGAFFAMFLFQESKPPLCLPGRQYTDTRLETPGVVVPPPSPVHFFEQSSSESVPVWAHADSLPQDLLKEWWVSWGWENRVLLFTKAGMGLSSCSFWEGREWAVIQLVYWILRPTNR